MRCCRSTTCGTGRFFSRFAAFCRKRYQSKGLERSQEQLVAGLQATGIQDRSLLEVGCGVGYLHQRLLAMGAGRAIGVDLSERMLDEARGLAQEHGMSERVEYRLGDFVDIVPTIDPADVTLLDKVICCYPDAHTLVHRTLDKTGSLCALTYPRDHVLNRLGIAAIGLMMSVLADPYRPYFYDPQDVASWIESRGFSRVWQAKTPFWLTQIYRRVL